MTKPYSKLFINYDRNKAEGMVNQMASFLLSCCGDAESLYVDLYAIEEEAATITAPRYIQSTTQGIKSWRFASFFKPISAYVCVQVVDADQLTELWKKFIYSSPKIYRSGRTSRGVSDFALPHRFLENFQYVALDELSEILKDHVWLFRDFHDDIGLEVLCDSTFEPKLKDLATHYLGENVVEELP